MMRDLSITQEYFLCALNEKGKISSMNTEKQVCIVASGLIEMKLQQCIAMDKNTITLIDSLPENMNYLKPLYDYISEAKTVKIRKLLEAYTWSFSVKNLNNLIESVGHSLEEKECVEVSETTGLWGNKRSFIPTVGTVNGVIDKVKAEIMEEGTITEEVIALVVLLEKSKLIKTYFSKFEQKEIKNKMKELINSPVGQEIKDMVQYIEDLMTIIAMIP